MEVLGARFSGDWTVSDRNCSLARQTANPIRTSDNDHMTMAIPRGRIDAVGNRVSRSIADVA